ncbi:MAG: ATPase [Eubacterium sp.]|nr:ATPase [Eubacterium sp.]
MYSDTLQSRLSMLNKKIIEIDKQLKKYPAGHLSLERNGPYVKWYHTTKGQRNYIPKKDHQLAEVLAAKNYLLAQLADLKEEALAIQSYLQHHTKATKQEQFLSNPLYQGLGSKHQETHSEELKEWASQTYPTNPYYPEHKKIKTISGNLVRSKAEAMIENNLYMEGIPFRYECQMEINGHLYYPDFMARHPVDGHIVIWEHLGIMDNHEYAHKSFAKIEELISAGYYPGGNLILTYETKEHPLTPIIIKQTIEQYF